VRRNKRASLELSIRAIVIVILAMTLLGLGLGFVRNMFQDIGGITTDVTEQIKEQVTAQLRTSGEKLSFPATVALSRGELKTLTIGVQNTGSELIYFGFDLNWDAPNSDHAQQSDGTIDDTKTFADEYDPRYLSDPCSFSLEPAEASAYGINLRAPKIAGTDMIVLKVRLAATNSDGSCVADADTSDNPVFVTKTTFISVG
tara:strand:+ start:317 stop:919 length:603 start_codon:yes stop_codon:yes gene_type:complete